MIRIDKHVMQVVLSLEVGHLIHACVQHTCVRSVTHATAPRWLGLQQQMRHSHEQALAQCCVLLSLAFEGEHGARLGDFNISIQNQTS